MLVNFCIIPGRAQCPNPRLYDLTYINPSSNPVWEHCIDNASDPDNFTLDLISPDNIENYTIDFGDGTSTSGAFWPANTPISHTYWLGQYTITLTETRNGCTRAITGTLINDRKAGAAAEPPTLGSSGCVPKSLTFKNISTNTSPYTIFEWDWGDGTSEIQPASSVGQPISHTYQRGSAGCGMVVTLRAYSLCDTTFSSYGPYDFWDIDTAAIAASATTLCGPDTVTFTDVSNYNCNVTQPRRIRWDFRELGGPLTPWLAAIPANRVAKYYVSGPPGSSYTVFLEDSNYCGVDRTGITVNIVAPPTAKVNSLYPQICAGENGVFTNTSTGGATTYRWNFGDGTGWRTVTGTGSQSYQYRNPGTYTVQLIAENGGAACSDTDQVQITVLPAPITDFTITKAGECGTVDVTFTDNTPEATSWNWSFSNGETRTGKGPWTLSFNPGTYQVQLTTANSINCTSSKILTFTIYPEISVAMQADSVCLGNPTEFKDLSTLLAPANCAKGSILREQWDNINGTSVSSLTGHPSYPNSPSSSSLLTLFESANNIGDNFGARVRGYICPPQTGNYVFWIASDDGSELWLSTDANPANKVRIAYVNGNTDPRQWTKYSSQRSESIYLEANQKYYIEALHKESNGDDHLAVGWRLPSGTLERPIPGTYLSPYDEGSTIQNWSWDFGDGLGTSNVKNPTYTYTAPGTYTVRLTVGSGKCSATGTINVKVNPLTSADFDLSDTIKCTPFDLTITNTSVNGVKYYWDMGDGTPEIVIDGNNQDTIQHTFTNSGTVAKKYYIRLISETASGCSDTIIKSISVLPGPIADFTFDPLSPKCSPVDITFTNNSLAGQTYSWYIGDYDTVHTTVSSFKYTFTNTTGKLKEDTVRLVAYADGCSGVIEKVVTVYPEAQFDIVATPDEICAPGTVSFSATGGAISFLWNFGDGTTSIFSTPTHSYNNTTSQDTTYRVRLIASSVFNCKDTVYKDIAVYPKPKADFISNVKEGCGPLKVVFRNLSSDASSYSWDFGDGTVLTSSSDSIEHTFVNTDVFAKTYKVVLTAYNTHGCLDTLSQTILVYPLVSADFSISDSSACSPKNILFTNKSSGATVYQWNFGDGASSSEVNPLHEFVNTSSNDTTYAITLIASSGACSDTITRQIEIYSVPKASFNVTPSGCSPLEAHIVNNSANAVKYTWDFGDGVTSTDTAGSFTHLYTNATFAPKLYTLTLTAESKKGCKSVVTSNVTVHPGVKAVFALSDSVGCSPMNVKFQNYSIGASDYLWDFANGNTSTTTNPSQTFVNSGVSDTTYYVTLIARSSGCADTIVKSVVVHPKPVASFVSEGEGCSPFAVTFTNTSTPGASYNWSFGDGTTSDTSAMSFVHIFSNMSQSNRVYPVNLVVKSSPGCTAVYN
ncbi:MAG TPA: PKD domain-containing protein, partial [Cytophagaceae bacterium]